MGSCVLKCFNKSSPGDLICHVTARWPCWFCWLVGEGGPLPGPPVSQPGPLVPALPVLYTHKTPVLWVLTRLD